MTVALVLFALAAVGGVVMALQRFRGRPQPTLGIALVHGAAAAAGLVALVWIVAGAEAPSLAQAALGLFLAAALGGFALFAMHLRKSALPVWLVAVHGLVAVIAFAALLAGSLG
jgi:hypothetical protein